MIMELVDSKKFKAETMSNQFLSLLSFDTHFSKFSISQDFCMTKVYSIPTKQINMNVSV